ncbi:iron-siderophore ABC transporter substrate-binding protein [Aggregatilinea lenta]|uniref:iron-siderophore ABC transporter substrate-binding protein n=1 Tax=Aggregatilinea lenta TaxID=913108 RepID=UPI000E5B6DDA|nr:iron-siderophore ABC transporter substrate-binding protein [Aggregatilinea lenta]
MRKAVLILMIVALASGFAVTPTQAQDDADPFPVTIEHKFGSTTIAAAPQRVVAIGYTEQDFLLALGVTPVAVRYWYGDEDDAIFPWADDKVEGDAPVVLNMPFGGLNYEAILALQPDLISAVTAGITQDEYDALSQIAPTLAQTDDYIDFGMPWQEVMQMIGDAVGKGDEAASIVADVDRLFADARAQNPEFQGKTVAVAYSYEGTYGFYTAEDSRGRFFTDLGFVMPDELLEVAGDSFYTDLSAERVDLLDQDLIAIVNLQFIEGGREALEADPLFGQLKAVQEGRVVYLDEQAENALGFSSPLSLAYALDAVLPQLEAIFGGSPAAVATEAATETAALN